MIALNEATTERRARLDRRQFSWRTFLFGYLRSRRCELRRDDDADAVFIDWHHPWVFFLAVGTMILSTADAFLTLQLIERGMYEANPIMAAALSQGTTTFAVSKTLMTGTSLLILVFLANARFLNRFRTSLFLTGFFSIYLCLVCYELMSLMNSY